MTTQQETIERLLDYVTRHDVLNGYEFKLNEQRPIGKSIMLSMVVGLIGDEDTLAGVYGRTYRMYIVGPRGSLKTWDGKAWQPGWQNIFCSYGARKA